MQPAAASSISPPSWACAWPGGVSPYAVSKAGVVQLTKSLALGWARHKIRVNALAPGYIETELNDAFFASDAGQALIKRIPQRRLGLAKELDGPVLLLASDASTYMTGSVVAVDGGHLRVESLSGCPILSDERAKRGAMLDDAIRTRLRAWFAERLGEPNLDRAVPRTDERWVDSGELARALQLSRSGKNSRVRRPQGRAGDYRVQSDATRRVQDSRSRARGGRAHADAGRLLRR